MNITHKMPMILSTLVLVMGLLYACPDADSEDSTPTLKAGDITYDSIAQGTAGTATPKSSTIRDLSTLKFSIAPIGTYTGAGTQTPPTIDVEDGSITTTATTSAGSYRVTITPDGITILGNPITVDFYVTIKAANIGDLDTKLQQAITDYGLTGDFNYIDTSNVTTMSFLFAPGRIPGTGAEMARAYNVKNFNGDISKWDVSAVTNFTGMFGGASEGAFFGPTIFNQDISKWDVSAGENFSAMFFLASKFNQDISEWKVDKGTNFQSMFEEATEFNQDISEWKVNKGTNFGSMFQGATAFNQDIGGWTVSAGTNFRSMFNGATAFNQDVSGWNLDPNNVNITDMFLNSGVTDLPDWYTQTP